MSVEEGADRLASSEFVRVVASADADGVSSAACVCSALSSLGVGYHFTALEDPRDAPNRDADVFCGIGAGYLEGTGSVGEAVVIEHHPHGTDGFDSFLVGTDAPSSSVAAYRVAREMSVGAGDPVAALVGVVGEGVALDADGVRDVVDEAVEVGATRREGARLVGGDPVEGLTYSTRPFTRLSGDYDAAREFVEEVDDEDLSTAVVLLALTNERARADAVAELVGDIYELPSGIDIHTLSRYVEACAVSGKHGLALSLCLDPAAHLEEARKAWRAFESNLIERVRGAEVRGGEPSVALITGGFDTGAVADALYDWVTGDVVVVNEDCEASFRAEYFDCERVARESARAVGGEGCGHSSRAGASFSSDVPRSEFVDAVRRVV